MRSLQTVSTSYKHDKQQIDFYATVNADNTPHITMITSLHIYDDDTLIWGEYSFGLSKRNQQERSQVGFLSVIDNENIVLGQADWMQSKTSGKELDALNQIPEFRYNNVNGFSPAHILKKKDMKESVMDQTKMQKAINETREAAAKAGGGNNPDAISVLTRKYMEAEQGFKAVAYVDETGYPVVLPLPQAMLIEANRIVFSLDDYQDMMKQVKEGTELALYVIEYPSMCSVLLRGKLQLQKIEEKNYGVMDVERVYTPMLPVAGYIYPAEEIKWVTEFSDVPYEYNV